MHRFPRERALSSAGLEHLPYKQRVGGSNPSAPTSRQASSAWRFFVSAAQPRPTLEGVGEAMPPPYSPTPSGRAVAGRAEPFCICFELLLAIGAGQPRGGRAGGAFLHLLRALARRWGGAIRASRPVAIRVCRSKPRHYRRLLRGLLPLTSHLLPLTSHLSTLIHFALSGDVLHYFITKICFFAKNCNFAARIFFTVVNNQSTIN